MPVNGSGECDFVLREGNKVTEAIQVCYSLNKENQEREKKGLISAMETFKPKKGYIITFDKEESYSIGKNRIFVIPAWKWLTPL
jgi:predicted AAA+ superfamily ATPase